MPTHLLLPIRINSHHHCTSTATTTTLHVNGQPHTGPIHQVSFFFFFTQCDNHQPFKSIRVHHLPPSVPIRVRHHPRPLPVAPTTTVFTRVEGQPYHRASLPVPTSNMFYFILFVALLTITISTATMCMQHVCMHIQVSIILHGTH